jgi:predicted membrane protein
MNIKMNFGAGDGTIDLKNINLQGYSLTMGAGNISLDLSGEYKNSVNANITGGVGKITIYLPKNMGVTVDITGGIGKVNAEGFKKDGGTYTNVASGTAQNNINVTIKAGVGEVNLILK